MILIFGSQEDPHVVSVQREIERNGYESAIIDIYSKNSLGLDFFNSKNFCWSMGEKSINQTIDVIWWRLKPKNNIPSTSADSLYDYYFQSREWGVMLDSIELAFSNIPWINKRKISKAASNKIHQLSVAEKLGFEIPRTIISNNFVQILEFMDHLGHTEILCKTITGYASPSGKVAFSSIIDRKLIKEQARSISICPAIYQEYIVKDFELRITIIGTEIFAVRIDGNLNENSRIDWRKNIFSDMYSIWTIENELKSKLLYLHNELGLIYATYDLIVDKSGKIIFLEVNPSGQWMWLEECLNLPISTCLAKKLISLSM